MGSSRSRSRFRGTVRTLAHANLSRQGITVPPIATQHHIASALNHLLASSLRVEIDEISTTADTGQTNLTALAHEIQLSLDGLERATAEQLAQPQVWEDGGLRVVWHARRRRTGEEAEPVIVV